LLIVTSIQLLLAGAFGSAGVEAASAAPTGDVCTSLLGGTSSTKIENLIKKYFLFKEFTFLLRLSFSCFYLERKYE